MAIYMARRLWTSLIAVCLPGALVALAWVLFFGGRAVIAELAGAYLMILILGRAQAADRERRQKPLRAQRVHTQLERIRSTLPPAIEH